MQLIQINKQNQTPFLVLKSCIENSKIMIFFRKQGVKMTNEKNSENASLLKHSILWLFLLEQHFFSGYKIFILTQFMLFLRFFLRL